MAGVEILAEGLKPKSVLKKSQDLEKVLLSSVGNSANLRIKIDDFRAGFLKKIPERLEDLLYIATYIYSSDVRIMRGGSRDVNGTKWSRKLNFHIPVVDCKFWQQKVIKDTLKETLEFLTGDEFTFKFYKKSKDKGIQEFIDYHELIDPLPNVDTVILFSGGSDSLAAVLESIGQNKHPILISHRSTAVLDKRQKNLSESLKRIYPQWSFPHLSMWVNQKETRKTEFTQRSRSFLYTSLGAIAADILKVNEIRLCDNGVMSINLPRSGQNVGTMLSRSTHPKYLLLVQKLIRLITENENISIINTLLFKTREDVLKVIESSGHPQLLQETVSCAHVEGKTKLQPHCGICTQCIDRRFASISAGLEMYDLESRYEKEIFTDSLSDGEEKTHAENYVRFANELDELNSSEDMLLRYGELYDCYENNQNIEEYYESIWKMFRRHSKMVLSVLENKIKDNTGNLIKGNLAKDSLIRMIADGRHLRSLHFDYIDKLRKLIQKGLPAAFRSVPARNETHVQDVGQSVFITAKENLDRESPQIPFAAVSTKPDFSSQKGDNNLFVEFKYIKERNRLNKAQTEMTSRVTVYRDQGASILFIVYDPKRYIIDDEVFVQDFENHHNVWVGVVR